MESSWPTCHINQAHLNARVFPRDVGGSDDRLVSRLADGGRLVSSHGDGRRYLLRLDDAGYRLQQLAGVCRSMGRKRPEMTAQWISVRLHHPPPIRPATRVATPRLCFGRSDDVSRR